MTLNPAPPSNQPLLNTLRTARILLSCGTGGVGKTTMSAVLGILAARLGRRVLVITIDPAKRLITSLGLESLGHEPQNLTTSLPSGTSGQFWAMMPDTSQTFEDFVSELTQNEHLRTAIRKNAIFQIFSKEFSGTNEYMALEKMHQLSQDPRFDLIILDTPPSRNTLAFLKAPQLLARFFDEKLIRWLVAPTQSFLQSGFKKILGLLESLTGASFMTSLLDFAASLFEVRVQFVANLRQITQTLQAETTRFLVVSGARSESSAEIQHFVDAVNEQKFHFEGVLLNRLLCRIPRGESKAPAFFEALCAREEQELARLHTNFPVLFEMQELARDVHNLQDLCTMAEAMRGDGK